VDRLCDAYAEHGLFDGDMARALDCDCPDAGACWDGVPNRHRPPRDEASISVPWIGPRYRPGGIAALAINQNAYGGLGALWWIRRGANEALRDGKRKNFDIGAGSYLAVAHDSLTGARLEKRVIPEQAADAWDGSALLEAIKCSPRWAASRATGAMWRNCPPRYLLDELRLIAPRVLLVIGQSVGPAVMSLLDVDVGERESGFGAEAVRSTLDRSRSFAARTLRMAGGANRSLYFDGPSKIGRSRTSADQRYDLLEPTVNRRGQP
jgi:hypothetical protein